MNGFGESLLSAEGVSVIFKGRRGKPVCALNNVSAELRRGCVLGIVGGSGSGKTTLARVLTGALTPTSGRVLFRGKAIASMDRASRRNFTGSVQMIFQDTLGALNPRMRSGEVLCEAIYVHRRKEFPTKALRREFAESLLERTGLPLTLYDKFPHEMSGGQRQRLGVARALAVGPEVLVADEPVSALDVSVQAQIIGFFSSLVESADVSMILIAHDLAVVKSLCSRVLVMHNGKIVEEGEPAALFSKPADRYTKELIEAVPDVDRGLARKQSQKNNGDGE